MTQTQQRTAFVTGAGQGLGAAIARRLAQAGDHVAVTDVDKGRAQGVADEIDAAGGSASAHEVDVTNCDQIESAMAEIVEQHGHLDVLVCNAGVTRDNLLFKMSNEDWDLVIATHLTGSFYCARAAQRYMVKAQYGKIVLVSSRSAQGNRGQTNYSSAKAGLQGMARTMAIELGPFGINVNAVAPGHIESEMTHNTAERMGLDYEALAKTVIERNSIKRVGQPQDVANAVAFLCSDESSYITGQVLHLTGRPLG